MLETDIPIENIEEGLKAIREKFDSQIFSFELIKSGGGYQFLTKPAYQECIGILLKQQSTRRLSNSTLETLAIIAYKQPVTRNAIEQVRGVNCDYAIQKLLEKELIEIKGRSDGIGRPLLYGTSQQFMDHFGINDLRELPLLKDLSRKENAIGYEQE